MSDFIVGVPYTGCPKGFIATREDEAVGIAVGAYLAGKSPQVYMQNSGLGNSIDIITSLLKPYGIKIEFLIENRNDPEHHEFMGMITSQLTRLLEIHEQIVYS